MSNRLLQYVLVFLLVTNVLYVTSGAIHFPLSHVDVWANWLYKAKAMYEGDGSIAFLRQWSGEFAHPQYPIFLPFLFYGLYSLFGTTNELIASFISPVVYTLTLLLSYKTLVKLQLSPNQSLLFVYLFSMLSPLLAQGGRGHAGMPDIYIGLLSWVMYYLLVLSRKEVRYSWVIVACVIAASLIKTEGVILTLVILFTKEKWPTKIMQMIIATAGYWYWQSLLASLGIVESYSIQIPTLSVVTYRSIFIFGESIRELFLNVRNWYIFWWIFTLGYLAERKRKLYLPFGLFLAVFFLLYLCSTIPIERYVGSSLDRLLLQISPFWLVPFAQSFSRYLRGDLFRNHDNLIRIRIWELLK